MSLSIPFFFTGNIQVEEFWKFDNIQRILWAKIKGVVVSKHYCEIALCYLSMLYACLCDLWKAKCVVFSYKNTTSAVCNAILATYFQQSPTNDTLQQCNDSATETQTHSVNSVYDASPVNECRAHQQLFT